MISTPPVLIVLNFEIGYWYIRVWATDWESWGVIWLGVHGDIWEDHDIRRIYENWGAKRWRLGWIGYAGFRYIREYFSNALPKSLVLDGPMMNCKLLEHNGADGQSRHPGGWDLGLGHTWVWIGQGQAKASWTHAKCILLSFLLDLCSGGFTVVIFNFIFHLLFIHFLLILLPNLQKVAKKVVEKEPKSSQKWLLWTTLIKELISACDHLSMGWKNYFYSLISFKPIER